MNGSRILALAGLSALVAIGSSCNLDPVHRSSVNLLGDEKAEDYPVESEYHRPGEPCALCHSDKGPASSVFVLGGTVFWGPDSYANRVDRAYVRIIDANKASPFLWAMRSATSRGRSASQLRDQSACSPT